MIKWYGVPAGFSRSRGLAGFAEEAGLSVVEAYARVVLVIEWLAEQSETGLVNDHTMLAHACGLKGAKGARVAELMWKWFMNSDGTFYPYMEANAAIVNSRARQRDFQRQRRAKVKES